MIAAGGQWLDRDTTKPTFDLPHPAFLSFVSATGLQLACMALNLHSWFW